MRRIDWLMVYRSVQVSGEEQEGVSSLHSANTFPLHSARKDAAVQLHWLLAARLCRRERVQINPLFNPKSLINKLGAAWLFILP